MSDLQRVAAERFDLDAPAAADVVKADSAAEPEPGWEGEPDCAAILADLLAVYVEDRAARPVMGRETATPTVMGRAAEAVMGRLFNMAREVLALPPPRTRDGLALAALASAILVETDCSDPRNLSICAAAGLTRAVLAFTGTAEPPGFCGFGDEADSSTRDRAFYDAAGSVPAWAVAEIEAADLAAAAEG